MKVLAQYLIVSLVATMFLPYRLMALELKRSRCWKQFLHYQKTLIKVETNSLRIKFLEKCKRSDLIPRFLKFRVPNNGCFDEKSIHEFQRRLLQNELLKARENLKLLRERLKERRNAMKSTAPTKTMPSIAVHTRASIHEHRHKHLSTHNKKLMKLSEEQEHPLFDIENTVVLCGLDSTPPSYVMETLALGPKNAVLDRFEPKDILAELDGLLSYCKENGVNDDVITDINVKTLNYIKKAKKMKSSRNIHMTKKYLKNHELMAVPFDKGIGICIMKKEVYHQKLDKIINLPQFEKVPVGRKNAKHPVLKEEERVNDVLKGLREEGKVSNGLYYKLKAKGSQPARLYGLAKVHKDDTPVRPVLSMPGSTYHKIGVQVAEWLSVVKECQINSSTQKISEMLNNVQLADDEELISFDVSSLYTNVPVKEAIEVCTNLLYSGKYKQPPVDRETFVKLAEISSCNILMSTHDGYYRQVDGLAMGAPPAPHFANGWLSQFDPIVKDDAKIFSRYMDDIIRDIKKSNVEEKLVEINSLHSNLKFTCEREVDGDIPFLDMKINNNHGQLTSTWYNKPTDTGLIMNYHALAPKKYKWSVVSGFVYRIHRACSTWENFHRSLERAKRVLEKNQYPPDFYEPIIAETIKNIYEGKESTTNTTTKTTTAATTTTTAATTTTTTTNPTTTTTTTTTTTINEEEPAKKTEKKLLFVQYRGKCTEDYARALHRSNVPCTVVMTLRKLRTVMPSLKPPIEKEIRSGVVYKFTCSRCQACYVGFTCRHLKTREDEHRTKKSQPIAKHAKHCKEMVSGENFEILASSSRSKDYLVTLEALWIKELAPKINTKDEWKSRELTIRL